jgi:hypothetical protein
VRHRLHPTTQRLRDIPALRAAGSHTLRVHPVVELRTVRRQVLRVAEARTVRRRVLRVAGARMVPRRTLRMARPPGVRVARARAVVLAERMPAPEVLAVERGVLLPREPSPDIRRPRVVMKSMLQMAV